MHQKIGIIGAGSWGKALASVLMDSGHDVILWSRNSIVEEEKYPMTNDIETLSDCHVFFIVVPAQAVREIFTLLKRACFPSKSRFILCSKGIEIKTLCFMSDICEEIFPTSKKAVLSGPNFAEEVIKKLPTTVSVASDDAIFCKVIMSLFTVPYFRVYPNNDMVSTQIIGATKNILAIACGIATAKNYGDNARASLITRGIEEIGRLIVAKNGNKDTFFTPAGIGDIILTCTSNVSRNFTLGVFLAQQGSFILEKKATYPLAEGVATALSIYDMAQRLKVEMPIFTSIYHILYEKQSVESSIKALLSRPLAFM